jgi:hypothetical protein
LLGRDRECGKEGEERKEEKEKEKSGIIRKVGRKFGIKDG